MDRNLGVAGGRNHAASHISTDWFLSLDNDMILTKNPLPALRQAVETLGVYYVNLPILEENGYQIFSCGGNLWIEPYQDTYVIGNSSVYKQVTRFEVNLINPFTCTFLLGGASLSHTSSFLTQSGYDDNMLVGFEDLEFSLRLYRQGIKIATASDFCLIHAHERAQQQQDVDYEEIRYSEKNLKASADYFFQKHGLQVWTPWVEKWLASKRKEVGLDHRIKETTKTSTNNQTIEKIPAQFDLSGSNKPRIALVADVRNWVFNNLAQQLINNLSEKFDFDVYYSGEYENVVPLLNQLRGYDLIHFFYRETLATLFTPEILLYFQGKGLNYSEYLEQYVAMLKITTSVFDHLFLSETEIKKNETLFNGLIAGYTVSSSKLFNIYEQIENYPPPTKVIEDGVDLEFFKPRNLERLTDIDRDLLIGWTGNSQWGTWVDGKDHKGFLTIIQPAVAALRAEGLPVQGKYIDRNVNGIPFQEMPDYYNSIDVLLCASDIEGTPNTVLEAMACGLPVISTDVGIVPEVFGELQKGLIVPARDVTSFKESIRRMVTKPQLREQLSLENLASIQGWSWPAKTKKWAVFFDQMVNFCQSEEYHANDRIRQILIRQQAHLASFEMTDQQIQAVAASPAFRIYTRLRRTRIGQAGAQIARKIYNQLNG